MENIKFDYERRDKVFEKANGVVDYAIITMIVITQFLILALPLYSYYDIHFVVLALFLPVSVMQLFYPMYVNRIGVELKNFDFSLFAFSLLFGGILFFQIILPALLNSFNYILGVCVGSICVILMMFCLLKMKKRTDYGLDMLGRIKGFKRFLETVDKEKLESQVEIDPTYFYDILPYTYVLGVSSKWIKKFESIVIPAPVWYDGLSTFSVSSFGSFMSGTIHTTNNSIHSSHVFNDSFGGPFGNGTGGSSSGGGSSGGGSGGGGGGSW
jgi:uncharacterized membrane protein YgcG